MPEELLTNLVWDDSRIDEFEDVIFHAVLNYLEQFDINVDAGLLAALIATTGRKILFFREIYEAEKEKERQSVTQDFKDVVKKRNKGSKVQVDA